MSSTEAELLRRYVRDHDETAFTELVGRHKNLVYSVAFRQTGGKVDLAKDIVQTVFLQLAKKAASIHEQVVLVGWLHSATVLAAAQIRRTEARRSRREQRSMEIHEIGKAERGDWNEIAPVLDQLLAKLKTGDRNALLLRFFEGRSLKEVGQIIGCSETGAHQRISRALEKLRLLLARRGITCSANLLSSHLGTHAIQIIPAGILSAVAVASAVQAGSGLSAFNLLSFMTTTKLKYAVIGIIIVAGITTPLLLQHNEVVSLRKSNQALELQLRSTKSVLSRAPSPATEAKPPVNVDFLELMRLRGEVGLLRGQLAEYERNNRKDEAQAPSDEAQQEQPEFGRLKGLSFKGNNRLSDTELTRLLSSKVGEPVDQQKLARDVAEIWKRYKTEGFSDISVRAAQETDGISGNVIVTFMIGESS